MSSYEDKAFNEIERKQKETMRLQREASERQSRSDNINPEHYRKGGIETIEFMAAKSTPEEFMGHLRLTAIKYLSRYGHKDQRVQELKKAQWYINRLIQELEA